MDLSVQSQLLKLNQDFYERFATSFSATRHQEQPGVRRLTQRILKSRSVLDIGCGNGTFGRALSKKGFSGHYVGVDMSQNLLGQAKEMTGKPPLGDFQFQLVNLSERGWHRQIQHGPFDWITCFAVLHHLPGAEFRQRAVNAFSKLISQGSYIAVSVWQWQNSPRLRKRVVPWSTLGLSQDDLDEGDVLLDWRAGECPGLRYVHTFDEDRLTALARRAGFRVRETFLSDGKTGNLALYQVWQLEN